MYLKYVGANDTSVRNDEGRKVTITSGAVFKTSSKHGDAYLKSKSFETASITEFDGQKKKPQVSEQPAPQVTEPVSEPEVSTEPVVEDEAEKPKKKKS